MDVNTYKTARIILREFGDGAGRMARQLQDHCLRIGDGEGSMTWAAVIVAIEELTRTKGTRGWPERSINISSPPVPLWEQTEGLEQPPQPPEPDIEQRPDQPEAEPKHQVREGNEPNGGYGGEPKGEHSPLVSLLRRLWLPFIKMELHPAKR